MGLTLERRVFSDDTRLNDNYVEFAHSSALVKTIEVCDLPVRAARFIARKNWVITGSDDLVIRVFNYNTLEKVSQFDGHSDYLRNFAVHPTKPFVLSCSDDMTVKLWDWEKGWKCQTTFEGHVHYVMSIAINPKDSNTFATGSLDNTIKIWSFNASTPNYTLEGHEKGINSVSYYSGGDRPYLVSGADDMTVRVWDYQTKACVRVLDGHTQNVSAAIFHPDLPIILSGGEDGIVKVWNSNTFRTEATFNFGLERVWSLSCVKGSTEIAVGCDEGAMVFQLGKGEPAASMDSNGKLIWSKRNEVLSGNVKQALEDGGIPEGQRIAIPSKELGQCEVYPQSLTHSPNGRYVVVCGDGEWIIYTSLAWRNKTFGKGLELVWAAGGNDYAVRETASKISIYQNFAATGEIKVATSCEAIFGGSLIGAACAGGQLCFFDWNTCQLVRRVDVEARRIFWSEETGKVAIGTEHGLYILQYHQQVVDSYMAQHGGLPEDGLESAFDFLEEFSDKIVSGLWIGDCFVFVNSNNRIAYAVGNQVYQLAISEKMLFVAGYLPKEGSLILFDKDTCVVRYELSLAVIEYESAILRGDQPKAQALQASISPDQCNRVAQFLESQGLFDQALAMATDVELQFNLALRLKKLDVVYDLACQQDSTAKWRQLGDIALAESKIVLAEKCFLKSDDLTTLLLIYSTTGNNQALISLGHTAVDQGHFNVAFSSFYLSGQREHCFELLIKSQRYPEAAAFARNFLPQAIERAVALWRADLQRRGHRAASLVADPITSPELFPTIPDLFEYELQDSVSPAAAQQFVLPANRSHAPSVESGGGHERQSQHSLASPGHAFDMTAFSDHMSMEVNTGNGSMRADDLDDMISVSTSEASGFPTRAIEKLSIHEELEEEHVPEFNPAPEVDPSLNQHSAAVFGDHALRMSGDETVPITSPRRSSKSPDISFEDDGWD